MLIYQRVNVKKMWLKRTLWHLYGQETCFPNITHIRNLRPRKSRASAPGALQNIQHPAEMMAAESMWVTKVSGNPEHNVFYTSTKTESIYTWKTMTTFSVTGLDMFFCPLRFFPNTAMSDCKPSTYRTIGFLNSWICRTGSDSMSVSSRDSIWGSMLTFAYCFFSTWCWKNTGILWVHPNLVGNMAVFVARFGYLITTPNLLHFGLKFLFWRLSEDVRTRCCQRIWTTLHNQKPKYAIEQKKVRYG